MRPVGASVKPGDGIRHHSPASASGEPTADIEHQQFATPMGHGIGICRRRTSKCDNVAHFAFREKPLRLNNKGWYMVKFTYCVSELTIRWPPHARDEAVISNLPASSRGVARCSLLSPVNSRGKPGGPCDNPHRPNGTAHEMGAYRCRVRAGASC